MDFNIAGITGKESQKKGNYQTKRYLLSSLHVSSPFYWKADIILHFPSHHIRSFFQDEMPALVIRKLSKRWGSYIYKSNKIILNPQLIKASSRHIDYVIIHELCHMVHRRHNRAFYDLLEYRLPEWEKLKTELELSLLGGPAIYSE